MPDTLREVTYYALSCATPYSTQRTPHTRFATIPYTIHHTPYNIQHTTYNTCTIQHTTYNTCTMQHKPCNIQHAPCAMQYTGAASRPRPSRATARVHKRLRSWCTTRPHGACTHPSLGQLCGGGRQRCQRVWLCPHLQEAPLNTPVADALASYTRTAPWPGQTALCRE